MCKNPHFSNFVNEDVNPCLKETKLSQKCLEERLYDYEKCTVYFLNYRCCLKFWHNLSKKRKNAGIFPSLPGKEEREKIMKLREKGIEVISAE